ncbi:MAG: redoxin domain-containing protein [Lentimicrobium sp.]|nr:redoxin domain-containing protein [Lentimicrobium sp.]
MKKILLLIAPIFLFITACAQNPGFKQTGSIEFEKLISDNNGILLDVRTLSEFKNGHLENAGQLNYYAGDFRRKLLLLPKDQPVYLYCNTGYRSSRAANILAENGYTNVFNLEHGIMEWNLKNLPVIIEPDAKADVENIMEPEAYTKLINSDSLVFIDFYAPWCAPCRKMMPMIDSLKTEYHEKINIVKINADASKKLMKELKIVGVPYLVMYHKGQLLYSKNSAAIREELVALFEGKLTDSSH